MAQTGAGRQTPEQPTYQIRGAPIVFTAADLGLKRKKSARRVSSRAARRLDDIERRFSRAVRRVSRAAEHGVTEYTDRRDRSAERRRDGALVDLYENVAHGLSVGISEASPAVVDVARAFNSSGVRRQIRRVLRGLPRLPIFG
jgi:hypothetical protein